MHREDEPLGPLLTTCALSMLEKTGVILKDGACDNYVCAMGTPNER